VTRLGIGVSQGQVRISLDENLEETDITQMLTFNEENVEQLLCTHAGIQSYWEALSIRLKIRHEKYKDEWVKKWWAHNNRFSKYVIAAYGDNKPSGADVKDMAIQIYSNETTDLERDKYAIAAFGVAAGRKQFHGNEAEFRAAMYKYLYLEPPWYFETMVSTLKQMQEEFEIVESVADRLNSQGFHLDLYAKMMMARRYNIGSTGIDESKIAAQVRGGK
jgi:hypothetical protein